MDIRRWFILFLILIAGSMLFTIFQFNARISPRNHPQVSPTPRAPATNRYVSQTYGFSFEYTSVNSIKECSTDLVMIVTPGSGQDCRLAGTNNPITYEILKDLTQLPSGNFATLVDGRLAMEYITSEQMNVFIRDGDHILRVIYSLDALEILNSTRFTGPPSYDVTKWKTISYPTGKFSFKYPPDYLSLDYPEQCFQHMKPSGFFGVFSAQFHVRNQSFAQKPDPGCEPAGEDGTQLEINVEPRKVTVDDFTGAFKLTKKFKVDGYDAYLLKNIAMGGEGGDRIYIVRDSDSIMVHLPAIFGRNDDTPDPLFMTIINTFTLR